jgi:hypothetical protein
MSTVRIILSNGRAFEWSGTREQGVFVIKAMESAAREGGITFDTLTQSCLRHALRNEERDYLMPGILALVLQTETGSPEHPGRCVDYLGNTDFTVAIAGGGESFTIQCERHHQA